ncbi:amidophosphoribosyltransferase [Shewanella colwelliana]|uniref:Amidophosphoribosyltransferase n=2 Tax=Shewanella colwelliana TaxID=23 RepID=A0A1E5IXH1_SHECO|nr:amidophosphoribosyltransferase [Shewanella colwelliana]
MPLSKWNLSWWKRWRQLPHVVHTLLLASLPNRCLICHQQVNPPHHGICHISLTASLYAEPTCLGCGRALVIQQRYCGSCMANAPLVVVAPCSYHDGVGEYVAAMKYQGQFAILHALVTALIERLEALEAEGIVERPQVLLPVPLHSSRLRERGFNQAWIIAKTLSQRLQIPLVDDAVMRVANTRPQAGLTGKQRRRNLEGAFTLKRHFHYQRVAIIDDVVTTGTTANALAKLFESRYIHVQVWCLARAEAPHLRD